MTDIYPGFAYEAAALKKYLVAAGIFTLSLQDGSIIHVTPDDANDFKAWLDSQGIKNIR